MLQEYSPAERTLVGERHNIFQGTPLGFTEAPHLYKRNGYYYLLTAEGGTGWGHAVTMARSRALTGPYELHPDMYILTVAAPARRAAAARRPRRPRRDAGRRDLHGAISAAGRCATAAAARSAAKPRSSRCTGGADGWLRTAGRRRACPRVEVPAPALPPHRFPPARRAGGLRRAGELPLDFQWLRSPFPDELFSLSARPGHLRLYGRETIGSLFRQALVARRQQAHCYSASTR